MEERLEQGLIAIVVLCAALALYLAVVVKEGPAHTLKQSSLNDKRSPATEANCASGTPPGGLKQIQSSVARQ